VERSSKDASDDGPEAGEIGGGAADDDEVNAVANHRHACLHAVHIFQ